MRRDGPERIYQAQRRGILRRLASGLARDGHYWADAWDWISAGRKRI